MAHTPPEPDETGADPAAETDAGADQNPADLRGIVQASAADLAAGLGADDGDQVDLFDAPEPLFAGPVRHVGETLKANVGRGRPKGSANKRTTAMRDYLLKKGLRHPMENLAMMANADPHQLAKELSEERLDKDRGYRPVLAGCTPLEAAQLIIKANVELMPYFESKRPVEVELNERRLGVLLIGEIGDTGAAADGFMSLTGEVRQPQRNQGDSDG